MATVSVVFPYFSTQTWVTVPTWTDNQGRTREYNSQKSRLKSQLQ